MEKVKENNRVIGLDALKVISMLMIVILHYFSFEYMNAIQEFSIQWYIAWGIKELCLVAVNCYVLITGYFLVKSKFKIKKIIALLGQVLFYSISITLCIYLFSDNKISLRNLAYTLLPIYTNRYWFINSYLALYLLFPVLNIVINHITQKQYKYLLVILILVFCVRQSITVVGDWTLDSTAGFGIMWFICLYLIAGYIRLYAKDINKKLKYVMIYFGTCVAILIFRTLIVYVCNMINYANKEEIVGMWHCYNSLPALIASVALFLLFKNMTIKNRTISKWIVGASTSTFAVYLIHQQVVFIPILWNNLCHKLDYISSPYWILHMIICVVAIFTVCVIIDKIRKYLVAKLMKYKIVLKVITYWEDKLNFNKIDTIF